MLTTVEQKLSAIKAINERMDRIENHLRSISKMRTDINKIDHIEFPVSDDYIISFSLPEKTLVKMIDIVDDSFKKEKSELMAKAEELMK